MVTAIVNSIVHVEVYTLLSAFSKKSYSFCVYLIYFSSSLIHLKYNYYITVLNSRDKNGNNSKTYHSVLDKV